MKFSYIFNQMMVEVPFECADNSSTYVKHDGKYWISATKYFSDMLGFCITEVCYNDTKIINDGEKYKPVELECPIVTLLLKKTVLNYREIHNIAQCFAEYKIAVRPECDEDGPTGNPLLAIIFEISR